jgi:hypothetical protein
MAARASSYSADAAFCTAGNTDPGIRARARNVGQITELTLDAEHEELGILGRLTPGQHCQAAEEAAREQVANRDDHSVMVPADMPGRARSSNRAPHPATRMIRRNTNRRHMVGDHHGRAAWRATLLVRAVDDLLGTHRSLLYATTFL